MLYRCTDGPITPFHEDEKGYIFLYFYRDSDPIPSEKSIPKGSGVFSVCLCGTKISVIDAGHGPILFSSHRNPMHYAAKERD